MVEDLGTAREIVKGVFIGLIVNIILLSLPYLAQFLGLNFPYNLLQLEVPFWITILAIIFLIPTVAMVSRRRRRGIVASFGSPRRPPEAYVKNVEHNYAGVKWKILYGRAGRYRKAEPYAFCSLNPYCPECDYEMESEKRGWLFKRYYWKCDRCGEFYRCPTPHPYNAHEVVKRLVEADFRTGRLEYP
jgi:ribosomal protein L37AE/L43A